MIVSLDLEHVETDKYYLAYSAKNKLINDGIGTLVKVVGKNTVRNEVLLDVDGTPTRILNIDTRLDAYIVPVEKTIISVTGKPDLANWPKITPKMLKEEVLITGEFEQQGTKVFLGTVDGLDRPRIVPINRAKFLRFSEELVKFAEYAEVKRKEREALLEKARERLEARKGEAIRLGKELPDGQLLKLNWALPIRDKFLEIVGDAEGVATYGKGYVKDVNHIGTCPLEDVTTVTFRADVCHAQIGRPNREDDKMICGIVWTKHNKNSCKDCGMSVDDQLLWIDYIINQSMFAKAHLVKDAKDVFEHGYLIDTNFPNRFVMAATACTRQCWEHKNGKAFASLIKQNVNPHYAFFAAQHVAGNEDCWKFNSTYTPHSFMDQSIMSDEALLNFFKGTPAVKHTLYFKEQKYDGTNAQWGARGTNLFSKLLIEKFSNKPTVDNPFKTGAGFSNLEAAALVQEIGDTWCKEMGIDINNLQEKDNA